MLFLLGPVMFGTSYMSQGPFPNSGFLATGSRTSAHSHCKAGTSRGFDGAYLKVLRRLLPTQTPGRIPKVDPN